jgi:hypothetical protein
MPLQVFWSSLTNAGVGFGKDAQGKLQTLTISHFLVMISQISKPGITNIEFRIHKGFPECTDVFKESFLNSVGYLVY